jgi:hypothetical protein
MACGGSPPWRHRVPRVLHGLAPQHCLYFLPLPQGRGRCGRLSGRCGLAWLWPWLPARRRLRSPRRWPCCAPPAGGRGGAAKRAGGLVQRLLRHVPQEIFKRQHGRRAAEDVVADFRLHVDHQLVEHLERLGLVFHERVALAVLRAGRCCSAGCPSRKDAPATTCQSRSKSCSARPSQASGFFKTDFHFVGFADFVGNEIADGKLRLAQAVKSEPAHRLFLARFGGLEDFASGMPSGKFKFTQSASCRTFPFAVSVSAVRELLHFQITTSSMMSMSRSRTSSPWMISLRKP